MGRAPLEGHHDVGWAADTTAHPVPSRRNSWIEESSDLFPARPRVLLPPRQGKNPAGLGGRAGDSGDTERRWQRVTNRRREIKAHASGLRLIQLPGLRRKVKGEAGSESAHICPLVSQPSSLPCPAEMVTAAESWHKPLLCPAPPGRGSERSQPRQQGRAKAPPSRSFPCV